MSKKKETKKIKKKKILVDYNKDYKKEIFANEVAGYLRHVLVFLRKSLAKAKIEEPLVKMRVEFTDEIPKLKRGPFSLHLPPKGWDFFEILNNYRHIHVAHEILSDVKHGNRKHQVIDLNLCQGNGIDIVLYSKEEDHFLLFEVYGGENIQSLGVKKRNFRNDIKEKLKKKIYTKKNFKFFIAYFECLDTKEETNNGKVVFKKV